MSFTVFTDGCSNLPGHLLGHTWLVFGLKELLGSPAEGAAGMAVLQ